MARKFSLVCAIGAIIFLTGCISFPSFGGGGGGGNTPALAGAPIATGDLRVMSFNVRVRTVLDILGNNWALRRGLLVETIRDFNPDLLGVQECLAVQGDYLRKELPGYGFIGAGRDDGRRDGEMCGVFYKTEKFQKLDAGHFWLSDSPKEPGSRSWGSAFPRMATWVKLRPRHGGDDFYFFNTHLDSVSGNARKEQSKLLRRKIDQIAGHAPVLLTGDFNTDEGTTPYHVLTGGTGRTGRVGGRLVDTFLVAGPMRGGEGTRHGYRGSRSGDRIDWILASRQFQPISAAIDHSRRGGRYPSDHFPVTAVLRWRSSAPVAAAPSTLNGG